MRVLLLSTPYPLSENVTPPLGLAYLAGSLRKDGFEVEILDFLVSRYRPAKLVRKLEEFRPQFVGATCVTLNFHVAARMLKVCKEFDQSIFTAIGGPHASFALDETHRRAPWIDAVVVGEGDRTVLELVRTVDGGGDIGHVAGIAFGDGESVVRTQERPYIEDLDELPLPARDLLPLSKYGALGSPFTVITSRGCPFNCIFCSANKMFGRKVRFRDPGLVVDEIEMLDRNYEFLQINIVDDTFTANRKHAQQVCEEMLRRNLKVRWSAYARVDTMREDLVELMKRAGCAWVLFGVESGDEEILKTIRKGITRQQVRDGVRMARGAGLNVFNSFIFGLPGESSETALGSVAFARELDRDYGAGYGFHVLSPLPGTDLYENARAYGIRFLTRNWARFDANQVITETPCIQADTMRGIVAEYEREVEEGWDVIRHRAEAGDAQSIDMVKGNEGQAFVWQLLKNDLFERSGRGLLVKAGDSHGAQREVAQRVSRRLELPVERVSEHLARLVSKGLLQSQSVGNGYRWCWNEGG